MSSFKKQSSAKGGFLFEKQGSAKGRFLFLEKKLIIIPFNFPKNWSADYITQTANFLAKNNQVIGFLWEEALSLKEIFINKKGFKFIEAKNGLIYFTPIHFIPLRRFHLIQNLNLLLNIYLLKLYIFIKRFNQKKKILWLFHPDFWWLPRIFGKSYLSLYDCADFFTSLNAKEKEQLHQAEIKLLKLADKVVANSQVLYKDKKRYRQEIYLVPQGFSFEAFKKSQKLPSNSPLFKLKRPLIGYIGGINYRLDYPLLIKLAKNNPELTFLLIGPFQKDYFQNFELQLEELKKLKNLHFLENQPRELLAEIIKYFDICLIPYDIKQEFNKFCYPMKVFEYFYVGKPTISTPIEELKRLQPYVKIAKDAQEFTREIRKILKTGWPKGYVQKQKELAIENSWTNKIEKIDQILTKTTK